jgi:hypothetical protein
VTSEFIKKAIQEAVELTGGPTNRTDLWEPLWEIAYQLAVHNEREADAAPPKFSSGWYASREAARPVQAFAPGTANETDGSRDDSPEVKTK